MKKILSISFYLLSFTFLLAQELPEVVPPSPTVANLMQLEEVPVSYYTGQPNISIPIYSKAASAELPVNIGLSYSTQGVKINSTSGWTGTSWSLNAGGSISRTVRGEPDESNKTGNNKLGILHNPHYWNYDNLSSAEKEKFNYKVLGDNIDKYDNKPDLYQFNFMGYSGRFVILKEGSNLVVKFINKSDQFKVEITHDHRYRISEFTIIDTKGLRYIFDVVETSTTTPFIGSTLQGTDSVGNLSASTTNLEYNVDTAWHLKRVTRPNAEILLQLHYQDVFESYMTSVSRTTSRIINRGNNYQGLINNTYNQSILEPAETIAFQSIATVTKKLQRIEFVRDNVNVHFGLTDFEHPETNGKALETISIERNGVTNKTFTFSYEETSDSSISVGSGKRLWLMNVRETAGTEHNDYKLHYNNKENLPGFDRGDIRGDSWGYYSGINTGNLSCDNITYSEDIITTGLLNAIEYPTGGVKEFEFEHNSYSYYQDQSLPEEDYMQNPRNATTQSLFIDDLTHYHTGNSSSEQLIDTFSLGFEQDIFVSSDMMSSENLENHVIRIHNDDFSFDTRIDLDQNCVKVSNVPAGNYSMVLVPDYVLSADSYSITGDFRVTYSQASTTIKHEMLGGGVRIKSIKFKNNLLTRKHKKHIQFAYNDSINTSISSGVIDSPLNKLERNYIKSTERYLFYSTDFCGGFSPQTVNYQVTEKAVNVDLSQGSYVGYRHVKVYEEGNGHNTYSYTSPYEYQDHLDSFKYENSKPKQNLDYKRGLLLSDKTYNQAGNKLKETLYTDSNGNPNYEFEEDVLFTDRNIYRPNCSLKQFYTDWDFYVTGNVQNFPPSCTPTSGPPIPQSFDPTPCGSFDDNNPYGAFSALNTPFSSGWAKLKGSKTKEYFYKDDGTVTVSESRQELTYNSVNYQVTQQDDYFKEENTDVHLSTIYKYPLNALTSNPNVIRQALTNQNRVNEVLETETYRNGVKLSTMHTVYSGYSTNLTLPRYVKTAKGNDTPEKRIVFKEYDLFGNPLEVSKIGGTPITYVWGYNNTLPVAKVDNVKYSDIEALPSFGSNFTISEGLSQAQKDDLQMLSNALVTTYTYNPLVGITSMTNPQGNTVYYEYDIFNRLKHIKDKDGNILSKNEYHYQDTANAYNYVKNTTYQVATTNDTTNAVTGATLVTDDKIEAISYFDGLGRGLQSIAKQAGGQKQDIITPMVYDALGRKVKDYLPYTRTNSSLNFDTNLTPDLLTGEITAINTQYQAKYAADFSGIVNPYSQKHLEASPLNRVLEQAAPGSDWALGSGHTIQFGYDANVTNDEVILFDVQHPNNNTENTKLVFGGYYSTGALYKTITKDENWTNGKNHTTEEYKNKQGQVILKRTYNRSRTHDTYYVYDDFGNLTYVLPPTASDEILYIGNANRSAGSLSKSNDDTQTLTSVNTTTLQGLGYIYHYDYRNRLIEKKIPGKDWEHIVYDALDRPILTQDAIQRDNRQWLFTKYDVFGRIAYTGQYNHTPTSTVHNAGRLDLQLEIANISAQNNPIWYESRESTTTSSIAEGYSNVAFPNIINKLKALTINYYDDYNFNMPSGLGFNNVYTQPVANTTKTLATGSKVKVLDTSNWITSVSYYDDKARPIYAASHNSFLKSTDNVATQLDFVGKVLETTTTHIKDSNAPIVIVDSFDYDHTGRLLTQNQTISSGASTTSGNVEQIVSNHYDALGQLIAKDVGGTSTGTVTNTGGLQTIDYNYNIRGWLKSINKGTTSNGDLFGFKLNYNTADNGATPLFNGNISETFWQTANDNKQRGYSYSYDALNRITRGQYIGNYGLAGDPTETEDYSLESIGYDKNGNIKHLKRKGLYEDKAIIDVIDNLTYTYEPQSNKLLAVKDTGTKDGFLDGNGGTDYNYDSNGNMVQDLNKGIVGIKYNHLNLPKRVDIEFNDNGQITYIYDATGIKLAKMVQDNTNNSTTLTEYAGGFIYENNRLKMFSHPEGYVEPTNTGYNYVYQYKDHLGNIRLSYASDNYQLLLNNDFYDNHDGWASIFGQVALEDSRLKVDAANQYNGAETYLGNNFTAGEEVTLHINFDKGNTDRVMLYFYEKDSNGGNISYYAKTLNLQNGQHTFTHTVNTSGYKLYLKIAKHSQSNDVGTLTTFYMDDVNISKGKLSIIKESNYYPFGLQHKGYNNVVSANSNSVANKFKYNGIEHEESLGLDLYEMPLRRYDPAIGRWTSIDPITHHSMSTYTAFDNNPIYWADPSGADGEHYNWDKGRYEDSNGNEVTFEEALAGNGITLGDGDGKNNNNPDSKKPKYQIFGLKPTTNKMNLNFKSVKDFKLLTGYGMDVEDIRKIKKAALWNLWKALDTKDQVRFLRYLKIPSKHWLKILKITAKVSKRSIMPSHTVYDDGFAALPFGFGAIFQPLNDAKATEDLNIENQLMWDDILTSFNSMMETEVLNDMVIIYTNEILFKKSNIKISESENLSSRYATKKYKYAYYGTQEGNDIHIFGMYFIGN